MPEIMLKMARVFQRRSC